jgi:hypothetical protein
MKGQMVEGLGWLNPSALAAGSIAGVGGSTYYHDPLRLWRNWQTR